MSTRSHGSIIQKYAVPHHTFSHSGLRSLSRPHEHTHTHIHTILKSPTSCLPINQSNHDTPCSPVSWLLVCSSSPERDMHQIFDLTLTSLPLKAASPTQGFTPPTWLLSAHPFCSALSPSLSSPSSPLPSGAGHCRPVRPAQPHILALPPSRPSASHMHAESVWSSQGGAARRQHARQTVFKGTRLTSG